jgi:hypothetical protein
METSGYKCSSLDSNEAPPEKKFRRLPLDEAVQFQFTDVHAIFNCKAQYLNKEIFI